LLVGNDDFIIWDVHARLLNILLERSVRELNYSKISGTPDTKAGAIEAASEELPMMAKRRVVYLEDASKLPPAERVRLASYIRRMPRHTVLIVSAPEKLPGKLQKRGDASTALGVELEQALSSGLTIHCSLSPKEVEEWIEERMRWYGQEIRKDAARLLLRRIGPNLRMLDNEIKKVMAYAGEDRIVIRSHVEAVVPYYPDAKAYELTDSIGQRDASQALLVAHEMITDDGILKTSLRCRKCSKRVEAQESWQGNFGGVRLPFQRTWR